MTAAPKPSRGALTSRVDTALWRPISDASLVAFRVMFGLILCWEVWRYFSKGWIGTFYLEPQFLFAYPGFAWVQPWPGDGMYWHFGALGLLAAMITVGLWYRLAMALFWAGFTYVFLLDQARYLNHFYLVSLLCFLMIFVPAARSLSLDAWVAGRRGLHAVPAWPLWLLRVQLELMLLFAGLVKLNPDWLRLEPLRGWLSGRDDLFLLGPLLQQDAVVALAAYFAIAVHLIGGPMLLFRRTRMWAFAAYAGFHLMNALVWSIGIFPWLALAGTLLFFDPDWPRQLRDHVGRWVGLVPGAPASTLVAPAPPARGWRIAVPALLAAWALIQCLVPLRFLAYPGNVSWHEQGHPFSWQMKLRSKRGQTRFVVRDHDSLRLWMVDPGPYLSARQERYMAGRPEMIRRFAHHLQATWAREHGAPHVAVHALTAVSLNGRPAQPLIDPQVDLTAIDFSLRRNTWVLPLETPLPPRAARWQTDFRPLIETQLALLGAGPTAASMDADVQTKNPS